MVEARLVIRSYVYFRFSNKMIQEEECGSVKENDWSLQNPALNCNHSRALALHRIPFREIKWHHTAYNSAQIDESEKAIKVH